jgi:hypothetical protein
MLTPLGPDPPPVGVAFIVSLIVALAVLGALYILGSLFLAGGFR